MIRPVLLSLLLLICPVTAFAQGEDYYADPVGVFSTRPGTTASVYNITRVGPVGISLDLIQPAFTMQIKSVEEGSPAQTAGLEAGQIIETINGDPLADIDPRIQLGQVIAAAEASDGVLRFDIRDQDADVVVIIPVLGAYSETWPLDCPKSDAIVRGFADYLSSEGANHGKFDIGLLFLLSTGEDQDLEVARQWVRAMGNRSATYAWELGYGGIPICEYYLRTGDPVALAIIQRWVDNAVAGQYLDAWAGRGGVPRVSYGGGHLNAAGTGAAAFLLMAKECGVEVPDEAMLRAFRHFFRYAGRGNNPYGDDRPYTGGFVDNGKNGLLAFTMSAAANLTPDGEDSLYAGARDVMANTSFYTTSFMLHGHTGGGIGEIWRSAAMAMMHDIRAEQYRAFMDGRAWHYDLSRRFDGSFAILGGSGYDDVSWGGAFPLAYTLPRGHLRICGAPRSEFSHPYELPERIWGSEADDAFLSLEPVPGLNGQVADLSGETLEEDSIRAVLIRLQSSEQPSDETLHHYIRHPYSNVRYVAACKVLGFNSNYLGRLSDGGEMRLEMAMQLLQHPSPRVRAAMLDAVNSCALGNANSPMYTREVFGIVINALSDPDESWWIKDISLRMVGKFPIDWTRPHLDVLLPYLEHEEAWLQNAAMTALTPLCTDPASYERVLPPIGELVRKNQRWSLSSGPLREIRGRLANASPEIQALAIEVLQETYSGYAGVTQAPGGQDITSVRDSHMSFIAEALASVPGGLDALHDVATDRFPQQSLPYRDMFLNANPELLSPELQAALVPIINNELIPEHVGRNRARLQQLAEMDQQTNYPGGRSDTIDQLVALHQRAGVDDYSWEIVADLRNAHWNYLSFDPIEAEDVPWDQLSGRYREVTEPQGSENWFAEDFNATAAGWRQGQSPFGQYNGQLPPPRNGCLGPNCYCGTPTNTLWENEVLMMQGRFELPAVEEGYRYRIRVNDGNHVGEGGGYSIYIDGELLVENESTNGRGSGGLPKGGFVTADFFDHFDGGQVTIAMQTFIKYSSTRYLPSSRQPQGRFSIHIERQLLPPMGDDLVLQSAAVVPMLTSTWQANQGEENMELQSELDKFAYDGNFVDAPEVVGNWSAVGSVYDIDQYEPGMARERAIRTNVGNLQLVDDGQTQSPAWIWSGNHLMDLTRYEALQMQVRTIADKDYLFVEAGQFSDRHPPDWQSGWVVLERR